ncbi:putative phage tail protein [Bradyrhizobium sp. LB14.3]|uniref:hypothetical protein n=1 Tax=Bradyrhizobium sp. LB14.3 TaxID=3156328 RepID=UPI003391F285
MLRTVHLHGKLGKEFGQSHRFDVATAGEALRALNCAFPGRFVKALEDGYYKVVRGDKRNGMQLDLELVNGFNLGIADLLALSGASKLLTKPAGQQTQASDGLNVNGGNIGNSGQQGNAVPLIYGECLVGTTPVEVWSDVEDISVYADSNGSIETAFEQ